MLSGLLITINVLVCIALIAVVLLQRSEGGAFGMGGGPTGLITARGAGDLLTRTTWILFCLFLALSLSLTLLGSHDRGESSVLNQLKQQKLNPASVVEPKAPSAPLPTAPLPTGLGSQPAIPFGAAPAAPTPSAPVAVAPAPAAHPTVAPAAAKTAAAPKATKAAAPAKHGAAPSITNAPTINPLDIAPVPATKPEAEPAAPPAEAPKPDSSAPAPSGTP